jgi:4-amino-4-deoxy-L-arabinose transferase-like glycosyltransferase
LPVTLAVTTTVQAQALTGYADWYAWLLPVVVVLSLGAIAGLVVARVTPRLKGKDYALAAVSAGMVSLLLAPSLWAASTIWYGGETRAPTAGPQAKRERSSPSRFDHDAAALLSYLQSRQDTARYLVASADQEFAEYAILQTNDPVISTGGFKGTDPVLSTSRLAALVNDGAARFFLVETPVRRRNETAMWINQHCTPIPKDAWQPDRSSPHREEKGIEEKGILNQLYDCAPGRGESDGAPALMPSRPPAGGT